MKKPGFLAATLVTACLFAVGAAAVAHHALTPGGPEVIESANAAEVRAAEAPPADAVNARRAASTGAAASSEANRNVSRAARETVEVDRSSSARVSAGAVRRKSIASIQSRSDDDDDDDDDD